MKPIDIIGLRNFRIFDDEKGFLEEMSSINILTGANNSGKSSIVKALQMLRNSIKETKYPFDLDLNQQEHLLGDFDNILYNKGNRKVEITLPFPFMGMKNLCVSLLFEAPNSRNTYEAKLRGIKVIDKDDYGTLFSFDYRVATDAEKDTAKDAFEEEVREFEQKKNDDSNKEANIFSMSNFYFPPSDNPLVGYVEWYINREKLKGYLTDIMKFYEMYLENKRNWVEEELERIDKVAKDLYIIPSSVINSFKKDADIEKWKDFVENKIGDDKESSGKEHVGERDFDADEFYIPPPEIENILYFTAFEVLRNNLRWKDTDAEDAEYPVIEHCFRNSWDGLIQRISSIHYVSNIKEENARSYNAASNSPFINLLKNYHSANSVSTDFMVKYLKAFEIGKEISLELSPKYQSILVSIITLDGAQRELVDFGYGIKQLILILIQISVLAQKNKRVEHGYGYDGEYLRDRYDPSVLIIEEPESNLHPKWQSLLADMFIEANRKYNIQLIIETHSEYLIRKFQTLVANNQIDAQNIKIFYLRSLQKVTGDKKQVESLHIEEDGSIDFNIFDDGFFDENYKLELSLLNIQFSKDFEELKGSNKDNEDKIIILQQKIDDFTNKADVAVYQQIITHRFNISKLSPISVSYLVSGQFLLHHINDPSDFSPVILQYGRAIENELKQIFQNITPAKKWMLGEMQGSLEKFKNGSSTMVTCSNAEFALLTPELTSAFNVPTSLRIELLNDLRDIRNSVGHAGHTKTKQEANDYILKANDFLDKWISEKK